MVRLKLIALLLVFCSVPLLAADNPLVPNAGKLEIVDYQTSTCGEATIILAWNAGAGATPAGYKRYQGLAAGTYGAPTDVGNVLTSTIVLTVPGTYYWAVTAYAPGYTDSSYSNEVSKVVTIQLCAPSLQIQSSSATLFDKDKVRFQWVTNYPATGRVQLNRTSTGSTVTKDTVGPAVTNQTLDFTKLKHGWTYNFNITAQAIDDTGRIVSDSVNGNFYVP